MVIKKGFRSFVGNGLFIPLCCQTRSFYTTIWSSVFFSSHFFDEYVLFIPLVGRIYIFHISFWSKVFSSYGFWPNMFFPYNFFFEYGLSYKFVDKYDLLIPFFVRISFSQLVFCRTLCFHITMVERDLFYPFWFQIVLFISSFVQAMFILTIFSSSMVVSEQPSCNQR